MKTQEEIKKQVVLLKEVRPKVRPFSAFGGSNLGQLDAQVAVLEDDMANSEIFDAFEHRGEEVLGAALEARQWIEGESEVDDLATDYPLKDEETNK